MGMTEFLLVVAVGGGIIAVLYATFRGAAEEAPVEDRASQAERRRESSDPELVELEDRRRAAVRALEEIEADRAAANLSESDYEALRVRYEKEIGLLDESIASRRIAAGQKPVGQGEPAATPPTAAESAPRIPAAVGWGAGVVAFLALAWLAMSSALNPRAPDGTITGSLPGEGMGGGAAGPAIADVDMDRVRALEEIVAGDSSNVEALVELGHLYLTLQRYGDVAGLSMKALQYDPDNPGALTHLGMVLVSVDHLEQGIASFDRALQSDPDFAEALLFKGMIAFRNQDFDVAAEAWERYVEVAPVDADLDRVRGMLEMARQNRGQGGSE